MVSFYGAWFITTLYCTIYVEPGGVYKYLGQFILPFMMGAYVLNVNKATKFGHELTKLAFLEEAI